MATSRFCISYTTCLWYFVFVPPFPLPKVTSERDAERRKEGKWDWRRESVVGEVRESTYLHEHRCGDQKSFEGLQKEAWNFEKYIPTLWKTLVHVPLIGKRSFYGNAVAARLVFPWFTLLCFAFTLSSFWIGHYISLLSLRYSRFNRLLSIKSMNLPYSLHRFSLHILK